MPIVGLAEVLVEPVYTGVQNKIGREIGPAVKGAGRSAGKSMGEAIATGLSTKTPEIEAEVSKYGKAVAAAEEQAATARTKAKAAADAEAAAVGNVSVAQAKLDEVYNKSNRTQSQLIAAIERLNSARAKAAAVSASNAAAQDKLNAATAKVSDTTRQSVQAQKNLKTHLDQVRAELERNGTAWGRLANSVRNSVRGRPMGEWTTSITRDSNQINSDLDNLSHTVEQSGTRGGRAFSRGFLLVNVALAGVVPLAGAASSALVGTAGAASTLAGSLSTLGGIAALVPAGLVSVGAAAGVMRAAFSGIGEAITETLAVNDRVATMGQNPRIAAMAIQDAQQAIVLAEEDAAEARLNAARRVEDAQQSLSDATENAAQANVDAARRVEDAQRGVTDAVDAAARAQEQSARQVEAAQRRVEEAARRVEEAQRSLRDAVEDVAESREDAARRIELAERREADAARDVLEAQKDLNEARQEAADRVKEVAAELEKAQLKTTETALALRLAESNFDKGQADPASSQMRLDQLALAVNRAKQADEAAKATVADLASEQQVAKREAVTASEAVLKAEQRLADARTAQADAAYEAKEAREDAVRAERDAARQIEDAQQAVTDAIQDQTDALRERKDAYADVVRTEQEGARSIADAQRSVADATEAAAQVARDGARNVADAQRGVADAVKAGERSQVDSARSIERALRNLERTQLQQAEAGEGAGEKSALAMSKLTPAAQLAAAAILDVYNRLQRVRDIAQENFFTGLVEPFNRLADVVLPQLETGVGRIATAFNGAASQLMTSLTAGLDGGVLESMLTGVSRIIENLTPAIDPLVQAFITLTQIGMPYLEDFAVYISEAAATFNTFIQDAAADGSLNGWIDAGIKGFQDIGSILSSTKDIFSAFNDAARAGGIDVTLAGVADAMNRLQTIMEGPVFQDTMATIFSGAKAGMEGLAVGGNMIADAFVRGADSFAEFQRLGGEITGMFVGGVFEALSNPTFGTALTGFLENVKLGVERMLPLMPGLTEAFAGVLDELGPLVREIGPTLVEVFTFFAEAVANVMAVLEPLLEVIAGSPLIIGLLIAAFVGTSAASALLTAAANLNKVATGALWVVTKSLAVAQGVAAVAMGLFTAATGRGTRAVVGNKVAIVVHRAATKAWAVTTGIATAAQKLFNAALRNNPIGLIITAIGLLVAGLVWFFTQTEAGKAIWSSVWGFITETATKFSSWFTEEFLPGFLKFFEDIPGSMAEIGKNLLLGLLDGLTGGNGQLVLDEIGRIVGGIISWFKELFGIHSPSRVFAEIGRFIMQGLVNGLKGMVRFVTDIWNGMINFIRTVFSAVATWVVQRVENLKNNWNRVWAIVNYTIRSVWRAIQQFIYDALKAIVRFIAERIENIKRNWGRVWDFVKDKVSGVWNGIRDSIRSVWNFIKDKIINPMLTFVRDKIPAAFEAAKEGVKKAWDRIKSIAKTPVDFVVKTVINEGLIKGINGILPKSLEMKPVKWPPKGWRTGGYTGDGNPDDVAGAVHKKEFVWNERATSALGKDNLNAAMHAAVRGNRERAAQLLGGGGSLENHGYFAGNAANVRRAGAYYLDVPSSLSAWNFGAAARMWDGASGLKVKLGKGNLQGRVSPLERGGGILGYTTGNNIDMSLSAMRQLGSAQRATVSAHEIGHAVGLPHDLGGRSIMHPNLAGMAATPTKRDIQKMQFLFPGGTGKAGDGSVAENPIKALVSGVMTLMKKQFPESSMFVDLAGGIALNAVTKVSQWIDDIKNGVVNIASDVVKGIKNFFGGGEASAAMGPVDRTSAAPMIRDTGGYVAPGLNNILNKTGQFEYMNSPADMRVLHQIAKQGSVGGQKVYNVQLPQQATVNDLVTAVNFEDRRAARGGRQR